jgi:phospholipase C
MLENRSFDHIFGYRPGVNGLKGSESNLLDPSKPESTTNPSFPVNNGAPWAVTTGEGPGHSLHAANWQLCNNSNGPTAANPASNNGFVKGYNLELTMADKVKNPSHEDIEVVMQSFAPARLPSINALADAFVLCDAWYSEVPGPTQPNRLFMHSATSSGYTHNVWSRKFDNRTIYNNLQDAGFSWATYEQDQNEVREFTQVSSQNQNFKKYDESFAADVKAGTLANYSFVIPRFMNAKDAMANSQHAPEDVRYADNFIADVYEALRSNPDVWNKSVLIVTYDEHGGFYDHVVPPSPVPNPDGINSPPPGDVSWAPTFDFTRLGFRVPAVICSPWVPAGRVDSTPFQHTSVLATLKKMFGLKDFLTKRDASARSFDYLFDEQAARTDTPEKLPRAALPTVSQDDDHPTHPANEPMDATQKSLVLSAFQLTQSSFRKDQGLNDLPNTQAEGAKFIQDAYVKHFGKHGRPGVRPRRPSK